MLFQASGVSLIRLSMSVALGERVVVQGPVPCARVGWRFMFQLPTSANRVVSIEGLDRLAELAGINAIFVNRSPGESVDWREGTGHYVYEVSGVSETTTNFSRSTVSSMRKCRSSATETGPECVGRLATRAATHQIRAHRTFDCAVVGVSVWFQSP